MRFIVVSLLVAVRTLHAQESQPARHVDEAIKLFEEHDYDGASIEFKAAYAIEAKPEILFAWAQSERLDGDCRTAVHLYEEFLATRPDVRQQAAAEWSMTRCQLEDDEAHVEPADLPEEFTIPLPPPPPPPLLLSTRTRPPPPLTALTLAGTGTISLGAALACLLVAAAREDDVAKARTYPDYLAAGRSADAWRTAAIAGAVIGGGLVVAGVVDLLVVRGHRDLHVTPAGDGIALAGSF